MPTISIITPLFNKEPYVGDTVRSVLAQTMPDWEMIVVENGSTDRGPEVVRQFSDPRIQLVETTKRGPGAARNVGIEMARGEWLLFLDADDLLQPAHLQCLLDCVPGGKTVDLVAGRWHKFTSSPTELQDEEKPACEGKTHQELLDGAIAFVPWFAPAVLVRRSVVTQKLLWPEHLDQFLGEDIAFWFKLLNTVSRWVCSVSAGALYRWKTADCRTKNEDAAPWFEGLHHAVNENLAFLKEINQEPTAGQSENLMRLYEGLLFLSLKEKNQAVAAESLRLARLWLKNARRLAPKHHALRVRQILGFRLFHVLKQRLHFGTEG